MPKTARREELATTRLTLVLIYFLSLGVMWISTVCAGDAKGELIAVGGVEDKDVEVESEGEEEVEEFVPTNQWQVVKPGQSIPRGLHVRMNLQTKQTEAKLMEGVETSQPATTNQKEKPEPTNQSDKTKLPASKTQEIKEALKRIKSDDYRDSKPAQPVSEGGSSRSMDEIKEDFANMNINMKTDTEIMTSLMEKLLDESGTSEDGKFAAMDDLEYYVHQFDNARDFVKMGGLTLIQPYLNSTSESLRAQAAFLLGSAMQSNPKVQVSALENGLMQSLLRLVAVDSSLLVRSRSLYALSCLVRHFPHAQKRLVELGGLSALAELFAKTDLELAKLQLKAVTLLHDLVIEQRLTAENLQESDELEKEKLRQYHMINIKGALVERGWCRLVPRLLGAPEHDVREKILHAMLSLAEVCNEEFQLWHSHLTRLEEEYQSLAIDEQKDPAVVTESVDYFINMYRLARTLAKTVVPQKVEL